jgi:hypothetical protein
MEVILEDVRCFSGRRSIPLRPLTLLVGENSTGKSSFLAAIHALSGLMQRPFSPSFNEPPYDLGTFDTIVPDGKKALCFRIGAKGTHQVRLRKESRELTGCVVATYGHSRGRVKLQEIDVETDIGSVRLTRSAKTMRAAIKYRGPQETGEWKSRSVSLRIVGIEHLFEPLPLGGYFALAASKPAPRRKRRLLLESGAITTIFLCSEFAEHLLPRAHSLAPIRMKPKRTHDRLEDTFVAEGDHVPALLRSMILARKLERSRRVIAALGQFGKDSGLYTDVGVSPLRGGTSAAFQVEVVMGEQRFNLVDVGYGVSQSLPIVVETALQRAEDTLLLQQPEVHLHPRAQAALGSFFCKIVQASKCRIIVETHSDYLVDRVRQEVAKKGIPREKVGLLFFDRTADGVSVHDIKLDELGNIVDPPPSYRSFFLQEEFALFSRGASDVPDN